MRFPDWMRGVSKPSKSARFLYWLTFPVDIFRSLSVRQSRILSTALEWTHILAILVNIYCPGRWRSKVCSGHENIQANGADVRADCAKHQFNCHVEVL
jgi:hypothetical protein